MEKQFACWPCLPTPHHHHQSQRGLQPTPHHHHQTQQGLQTTPHHQHQTQRGQQAKRPVLQLPQPVIIILQPPQLTLAHTITTATDHPSCTHHCHHMAAGESLEPMPPEHSLHTPSSAANTGLASMLKTHQQQVGCFRSCCRLCKTLLVFIPLL